MNLITAMEIYNNYPDNILISSRKHETGKYTSLMYLSKGDFIHRILLSFDPCSEWSGWDTDAEAIDKMQEMAQLAIDIVESFNKKR